MVLVESDVLILPIKSEDHDIARTLHNPVQDRVGVPECVICLFSVRDIPDNPRCPKKDA
jgi:hypothetical protein